MVKILLLIIVIEACFIAWQLYEIGKLNDKHLRMLEWRLRIIQRLLLRTKATRETIEESPISTFDFGEKDSWEYKPLKSPPAKTPRSPVL